MVIRFSNTFKKGFLKASSPLRNRIQKQLLKIERQPLTGKPMKHGRFGTREVRVPPFRLSYQLKGADIWVIRIYHKDEQ